MSQGNDGSTSHYGALRYALDFDYSAGQTVVAAADGVVDDIQTGVTGQTGSGYGNFVRLRHHDGTCTLYGHMQYGSVRLRAKGTFVAGGESLGQVGNTGYTLPAGRGHHLHFHRENCAGTTMPVGFRELGGGTPVSDGWYMSQNDLLEPSSTSMATYPDGRMEIWGVNTRIPNGQSNIFHKWQTRPGGAWSGWEMVPGYLTSIAAAMNADGRMEVWGVNTRIPDGTSNIFHKWQQAPGTNWSNWSPVSGYLTSLSIAVNADGRLEVWGVNTHIAGAVNIFHKWQQTRGANWSSWSAVAGYLTQLSLAANADGRLEVWGVNTRIPDGQSNIFNRWQQVPGGNWSGWALNSGYLTGLSLGRNADGRLEVWGVNTHIAGGVNIFQKWQQTRGANWSSWSAVAGYLTSLSLGRNGDGRLEVWGVNTYLPGGGSNIFNKWQLTPGGSWSGWALNSGYLTS